MCILSFCSQEPCPLSRKCVIDDRKRLAAVCRGDLREFSTFSEPMVHWKLPGDMTVQTSESCRISPPLSPPPQIFKTPLCALPPRGGIFSISPDFSIGDTNDGIKRYYNAWETPATCSYVFTVGVTSFAVCYKHGPLENERSISLLTWTLQLLGLLHKISLLDHAHRPLADYPLESTLHVPIAQRVDGRVQQWCEVYVDEGHQLIFLQGPAAQGSGVHGCGTAIVEHSHCEMGCHCVEGLAAASTIPHPQDDHQYPGVGQQDKG
ncbi:hypothetical protein A6R68_18703 [Neotoma lepida]|uniref:Uncharacterized protein n=1 Tax=Neotoma lepida TaxID=56216 RepID=A0A1A6HLR8_NEOLE|nr:hypothetical protein A6R68_18703 [Neotoma lepida]